MRRSSAVPAFLSLPISNEEWVRQVVRGFNDILFRMVSISIHHTFCHANLGDMPRYLVDDKSVVVVIVGLIFLSQGKFPVVISFNVGCSVLLEGQVL